MKKMRVKRKMKKTETDRIDPAVIRQLGGRVKMTKKSKKKMKKSY